MKDPWRLCLTSLWSRLSSIWNNRQQESVSSGFPCCFSPTKYSVLLKTHSKYTPKSREITNSEELIYLILKIWVAQQLKIQVIFLNDFLNQCFGALYCNALDASNAAVLWKFRVSVPCLVVLSFISDLAWFNYVRFLWNCQVTLCDNTGLLCIGGCRLCINIQKGNLNRQIY